MKIPLMGRAGLKIRAGDGCEQPGFPEMLSTSVFYLASPGDKLALTDTAYKFNVATYLPEIEPRWIYTYDYAPDQSWTIYNKDLSGDSYRQSEYVFDSRVYFRVCLRKKDGSIFNGTEDINKILKFEVSSPPDKSVSADEKPWLSREAKRVADRVNGLRKPDDFVFILITDSHYNVNGTWSDTSAALRLLTGTIDADGIIHLGDLTDGMVNADATRYYVKLVLDDLKACDLPVYVTTGNHDSNYFRGNPERLTTEEQRKIYLGNREIRYFIDYPKLRLIFLDSFDAEETKRYGYSPECIRWLNAALKSIEDDSNAIVFSHLSPVTRLQYWTDQVRGEADISAILKRHKDKIIAWVNGHSHADSLGSEGEVPAVTIANAKCEAFTERKPEGFITPGRQLGDASQELFDILILRAEKREARFIRFGAGQDRYISNGKVNWVEKQ